MSHYKYAVVPIGFADLKSHDAIPARMQSILCHYGSMGWEYVRMESIPFQERSGCLALFSKPEVYTVYQLVFKMQEGSSADGYVDQSYMNSPAVSVRSLPPMG